MHKKNQHAVEIKPALTATAIRNKVISMLSLARKAGKLNAGADSVKEAVLNGQVSAVFTASDLSSKSLKEIEFACRNFSVPVLSLGVSMDEMSAQIGRRSGILAVTDKGMESKICSLLSDAAQAEESEEKTETLSRKESC